MASNGTTFPRHFYHCPGCGSVELIGDAYVAGALGRRCGRCKQPFVISDLSEEELRLRMVYAPRAVVTDNPDKFRPLRRRGITAA